ncbi:MAG: T9SS type A sorting domain-containing protein [Flavobacterium sp.]
MRVLLTIVVLCFAGISLAQQCQNPPTAFVPITDLGLNTFNGWTGGLYGNGSNEIPQAHQSVGIQIASTILPRNASGGLDANGKIGFISMGMSNANMFFSTFREQSIAFPQFNPRVTMVNGATGGKDIDNLLDPNDSYWTSVDQKMAAAQLTNAQVQVIWFEQAKHISGIPPNEGINHIAIMEQKFLQAFQYFKQRYPNLRQIFCSGRDYGGYSNPGLGNPEPYAYYTNWAFRKLMERQLNGDPALHFGNPQTPTAWLAWSGHLWANGAQPRNDGFQWLCLQDVMDDGVHPSPAGRAKIAAILLQFFSTSPVTPWYRQQPLNVSNLSMASWHLVPNPAHDVIEVLPPQPSAFRYRILALTGQVISTGNTNQILVSSLPQGVYFMEITPVGESTFVKRFVVGRN